LGLIGGFFWVEVEYFLKRNQGEKNKKIIELSKKFDITLPTDGALGIGKKELN
jgi:hypothetical protein